MGRILSDRLHLSSPNFQVASYKMRRFLPPVVLNFLHSAKFHNRKELRMQKRLFLLCGGLIFSTLNSGAVTMAQTSALETQELVSSFYSAYNRMNLEELLSFYPDTVHFEDPTARLDFVLKKDVEKCFVKLSSRTIAT